MSGLQEKQRLKLNILLKGNLIPIIMYIILFVNLQLRELMQSSAPCEAQKLQLHVRNNFTAIYSVHTSCNSNAHWRGGV